MCYTPCHGDIDRYWRAGRTVLLASWAAVAGPRALHMFIILVFFSANQRWEHGPDPEGSRDPDAAPI